MPKQTFVWDPSRREFIKRTSLAAAAAMAAPFVFSGCKTGRKFKPNDEIRVAVVGAGGKGSSDTDDTAKAGGRIVALCDVDQNTLDSRKQKYPDAQTFKDYRVMYDKIGKDIDAVIVATPDHHHAPASVRAIKMGKHCFTQKPLTQSVYEARTMRQLAKKMGVATQMGNQGSAGNGLRRAVEVIQSGVIGKPKELHVWSNRPIWPQGLDRPEGQDQVPSNLDWDLWLGPAAMRPYKKDVYHTFKWRGWKDFGTGALGDMACHTVNMPFRALKLGYPSVVECEATSDNHKETFPKSSRIRFEFPEREGLPPLKFWWYDGSPGDKSVKPFRPNNDIAAGIIEMRGDLPASGALIIGEKGQIFSPDDYGSTFFLKLGSAAFKSASSKVQGKDTEHEAIANIPQTIPRSPGHYVEWIEAMRGGRPAYSNFDIAAYLTEIILLGCVALNVGTGKKLEWDGPNMRATNEPAAAKFVKREYRKGWEV
jgi:predicted dehydrogenase